MPSGPSMALILTTLIAPILPAAEFFCRFSPPRAHLHGGSGGARQRSGKSRPGGPRDQRSRAAAGLAGYRGPMTCGLVIVGGGNMGEAVLAGLLDAGWAKPDELAVVEVLAPRRAELAQRY